MLRIYFIIGIVLMLTGCADYVSLEEAARMETVGFLHGFWHGVIIPFAFLSSIFVDGIGLYATYNNGMGYDFGYFLGLCVIAASINSESES